MEPGRLSGSVTASEGLEGLVLYFGGPVINETAEPEENGSFSVSIDGEPRPGDWADVYAIDRWELQSATVTDYF